MLVSLFFASFYIPTEQIKTKFPCEGASSLVAKPLLSAFDCSHTSYTGVCKQPLRIHSRRASQEELHAGLALLFGHSAVVASMLET